ncbi:MAG TPA: hypothetical protein DCY07_05845, partial [Rhodospirillaceae bacterium]|nr:hypothetical protein [Rhodospirillaceae bacterium]
MVPFVINALTFQHRFLDSLRLLTQPRNIVAFGLGLLAAILFVDPVFAAEAKKLVSVMPSMMPAEITQVIPVQRTPDLLFGLLIGVMLTASLYLFFIWVVIRDRSQILLMLLLLCLSINMASTNESMTQVMGLHDSAMLNLLQSYSLILAYLASLLFTYSFLEVETNAPEMRLPVLWSSGVLALILTLAVLRSDIHFLLPSLGAAAIGLVLATGLMTLRMGVSGSLSHITAFTAFLVGTQARPLHDLGIIAHTDTANNIM